MEKFRNFDSIPARRREPLTELSNGERWLAISPVELRRQIRKNIIGRYGFADPKKWAWQTKTTSGFKQTSPKPYFLVPW
jgi:hypothetical protein